MPNRLANSSSPYLQQHADNPVDWFEWGDSAWSKAQRENKPVLLSVGYSACHWCHVMAHESFDDEETAELMNKLFINIKVDREERPDIDKIYQTSQSLLTQRTGGWPLTMFLDPQTQAPFFGGTYFPKASRSQLPAFKEVLVSISDYFKNHQDEIQRQGTAVKKALEEIYASNLNMPEIPSSILETAYSTLANNFDPQYGGFGGAPKFPHPGYLNFLIYYQTWSSKPETAAHAAEIALFSLKKMTYGGIYDQLGGGFYRYAVDDRWLIPHFEKMLYDNGSLLSLLADAYRMTTDNWYADKARETATWTIKEMQSATGGYYSSLDADSKGGEGAFYVWDEKEVCDLLSPEDAQLFKYQFGLDKPTNFEGKWHLYMSTSPEKAAAEQGLNETTAHTRLTQAKAILTTHRNKRPAPGRDDKILTAWNALMIKGMVKTALALNDTRYGESAEQAFDFIRNTLYVNGELHACWNETLKEKNVFLDDFAFLIEAALYLLQYRWDNDKFQFTLQLADTLIKQFEDHDNGGYFFTPEHQDPLIQRPRTLYDEAMPSGYGTATLVLTHLGFLCGREDYLHSANQALQQASTTIARSPDACATLLQALGDYRRPPLFIILRGHNKDLEKWRRATYAKNISQLFCFAIPVDIQNLPAELADKKADNKNTLAYICEGTSCQMPINNLDEYINYLAQYSHSSS